MMETEKNVQESVAEKNRLEVTEQGLGYFRSCTGWAQFIAIVSFILCGLLAITGVLMIILSSVWPGMTESMAGMSDSFGSIMTLTYVFLGILYLIIGVVGFIIAYNLYQFSVEVKKAVLKMDTDAMTNGVRSLFRYFKISGIITIVTLVLGFLCIPAAILIASLAN